MTLVIVYKFDHCQNKSETKISESSSSKEMEIDANSELFSQKFGSISALLFVSYFKKHINCQYIVFPPQELC